MIINVTRDFGADLWRVAATEDDGSKITRNGNDVPFRPSSCAHGVVWDRVGELVSGYSNGEPVSVVYRDDNNMAARVAHKHAKRLTVTLPHRVWRWIGWRDISNAMLRRAAADAEVLSVQERGSQSEQVRKLTFPAVPGVRAALDLLVQLVDGVREARRHVSADFAACQNAIERLDKVYRELSTPWCDTCKSGAIRQEHPARWAHTGVDYPLGIPESLDESGHEVTAKEWSQA